MNKEDQIKEIENIVELFLNEPVIAKLFVYCKDELLSLSDSIPKFIKVFDLARKAAEGKTTKFIYKLSKHKESTPRKKSDDIVIKIPLAEKGAETENLHSVANSFFALEVMHRVCIYRYRAIREYDLENFTLNLEENSRRAEVLRALGGLGEVIEKIQDELDAGIKGFVATANRPDVLRGLIQRYGSEIRL